MSQTCSRDRLRLLVESVRIDVPNILTLMARCCPFSHDVDVYPSLYSLVTLMHKFPHSLFQLNREWQEIIFIGSREIHIVASAAGMVSWK